VPLLSSAFYWLGWVIRLVMLPIVVRRKRRAEVALAWLSIIFLAPLPGLVGYLLFGEVRLGTRRIRRHAREVDVIERARQAGVNVRHIAAPPIEQSQHAILHVATELGGLPVLGGNRAELIAETWETIDRLIADLDAAQHHVHLLFYIYVDDEVGSRVSDALVRARGRGVDCRLLVDAVGSRCFLKRGARNLIRHGVEVAPALPVNPIRSLFARIDVRNHRKLAVIDGRIAYTGSQNIVRPDYGRRHAGFEWRDLMVRLTGPTVTQLQAVFLEDWEFEAGSTVDDFAYIPPPAVVGSAAMQVVPSGPNHPTRVLRDVTVEALHAARERVVITTPYLIPDEAMLVALRLAAVRGVRVDLIIPERSDQLLVGLAGEYFVDELLDYGVHVHLYQDGLLHVKTMTADAGFAMLGTANFDVRSFYLNFELNLLSYDPDLNGMLRFCQSGYMERSREVVPGAWRCRAKARRWGAACAKLVSPLL